MRHAPLLGPCFGCKRTDQETIPAIAPYNSAGVPGPWICDECVTSDTIIERYSIEELNDQSTMDIEFFTEKGREAVRKYVFRETE
jgi:hypothetical protein